VNSYCSFALKAPTADRNCITRKIIRITCKGSIHYFGGAVVTADLDIQYRWVNSIGSKNDATDGIIFLKNKIVSRISWISTRIKVEEGNCTDKPKAVSGEPDCMLPTIARFPTIKLVNWAYKNIPMYVCPFAVNFPCVLSYRPVSVSSTSSQTCSRTVMNIYRKVAG